MSLVITEPPVDNGGTGVIGGTTVIGYDGESYDTSNPGVYDVTHITPTENSTNQNEVVTQIVTEACPGDHDCRIVTQVAMQEGDVV